ncbi:MAG TPA: FAD-dependent monooxygenase [Terriglobia bacterium]|nr:FAD-dependent monooxygenase [Terriglobia bacterium]
MIDLGIIGAGPAGAMAAIEAARSGLQVALWDRATFPRDKVCGEFLSPESIPLLEKVVPAELSRAATIRRAEFYSKKGRSHCVIFPMPGAGLSRQTLDNALWRAAAAAGADCHENQAVTRVSKRRSSVGDDGPVWEVASEGAVPAGVRDLLLACGRWWKVDGLPSPVDFRNKRSRGGEWVGAKAHFAGIELRDAVEMYFFQGGYCGLAPTEGGIYNACFLLRRTLARSRRRGRAADFRTWINEVAEHPALAERLRSGVQASETIATAPVVPARRSAILGGALAIGDAAGFLDPFTGDGISIALHSGQLAACELVRGLRRPPLQAALRYRRHLNQSVRRTYFWAALLRALLRAPVDLQDWIASTLPSFATARFLSATRWRRAGAAQEIVG